jgi:hypothetical protein
LVLDLATAPKPDGHLYSVFDIADPHLQMSLAVLTAPDERRVQGHHDRRRLFGPDRDTIPKHLADFQGMAAQGLRMRSASTGNICFKTSAAVL